jgi:ribonuclease III
MTDFEAVVASVQEVLGYRFRDPALLRQALGAWNLPLSPEAAIARQRLEFLGDAAWGLAVAHVAYEVRPQATAGDLTRFRAAWCSSVGLAHLARQIGLPPPEVLAATAPSGQAMAETPEGRTRGLDVTPTPEPSERALAEVFEAILGAMVEDGGLDTVRALAHRVITQERNAAPPPVDPKSALQMLAQSRYGALPAYRLLERRGPAHHPTFRVAVRVNGDGVEVRAEAEGTSRQAAEQEAARLALQQLTQPTHA